MTEPLTWRVRATVIRVIDGDTFVCDLDLGWGIKRHDIPGVPCRVRLLHYNSPERGDPGWATATANLDRLLPSGSVVWVTSHRLDSFGRCLADVHLLTGEALLDLLPQEWRID